MAQLEAHVNQYSSIKLGTGWNFLLTIITPISLLVALLLTIKAIITEGYGGYPASTLWLIGGGVVAFFVLGAILLSLTKDTASKEN